MDERPLGLLTIHVKRGTNLAVRDALTSDPYVVITLPGKTMKTTVVKSNLNPTWNEEMTVPINDPNVPIFLAVFDYDKFSGDDEMGNAKIDIEPFLEALQTVAGIARLPSGCAIKRVQSSSQNCLSDESNIVWVDGKVTQEMTLRLKDVECGEIEIMLEWHEDGDGYRGVASLPSTEDS